MLAETFPTALRHDSGVMMALDPGRLLLAFEETHTRAEVGKLLHSLDIGLVLEDAEERGEETLTHAALRSMQAINHSRKRFWIRTRDGSSITQKTLSVVRERLGEKLDWIGPVYRLPNVEGRGGLLCPLPNVLVLKPGPSLSLEAEQELASFLNELGLKEISEKSRYLNGYHYFTIAPDRGTVYRLQPLLLKQEQRLIQEAFFENMPLLQPLAAIPNDTLFAQQWDMTRIHAPEGWDITTGQGVVVTVIDTGCDLSHPDLQPQISPLHIDLDTMQPGGGPNGDPFNEGHGTCCAGIVAATFNNSLGVAGEASGCQIMPLAFQDATDVEVARGITFAADNGAKVISMSFGEYAPGEGMSPAGWNFAIIDPAIAHAFNDKNCVLCAATGNENYGIVNRYPARHPLVMACGASDEADNRKSPSSPDGEPWGSNYGPDVSVVAPGVHIPTTDIQGTDGYNHTSGANGNYVTTFDGTSAATPHVAALAALLRSEYPWLTNVQVRNIIEQTAAKVGAVPYDEVTGYPNGTRNQEMGYGRIDVFHALDYADAMIKDWPGDTGREPSTAGDFWDFSDIVLRNADDNVFDPTDPSKSNQVKRGQTNYLYIRVTNNGPHEARNVVVDARITPYVGVEFIYPADWTAIDTTHVCPTPVTATFTTIPAGDSVIAKFTVSSTQVEDLWGWTHNMPWHPCLLARVTADNDYALAAADTVGGSIVVRRNNLAQRNLTVVDVTAGASLTFPFLVGHLEDVDRFVEIVIDRRVLPKDMPILLALDDDARAFPRVELKPPNWRTDSVVFLDRTRLELTVGSCHSVLTLEKGSRLDYPQSVALVKEIKGGEVVLRDGKRFVDIKEPTATVSLEKHPHQVHPFSLQTSIPSHAEKGEQYMLKVFQRNQRGHVVGGATVVYRVV